MMFYEVVLEIVMLFVFEILVENIVCVVVEWFGSDIFCFVLFYICVVDVVFVWDLLL